MDRIDLAVERLHSHLPLRARQQALPAGHAAVHRAILLWFAEHHRPPAAADLPGPDIETVLDRLAADDLIVRSGREVVGAYPFTLEPTGHRVRIGSHRLHAMCSLDAVAIAPVFGLTVDIESECAMTGTPVTIRQRGSDVLEVRPVDLMLGVRWSDPTGCAAHSMCRDMVFLAGETTALEWRGDPDAAGVYTLTEGVEFGARFFGPLLVVPQSPS
ncbi:MAG TPA: alkylmercury lyase family protein [Acidimicrobiia bacterium]|nr:alkylmercury lyase family protein [Acidimicrobiia bacterium]